MIVPYLSDVAIYCEQVVFLYFYFYVPALAVPRRVGPSRSPLTSACVCTPCKWNSLCRAWKKKKELQGSELQPQLKDNAVAVASDFEISNPFSVSEGSTDKTRERGSFFLAVLFFRKKKKKKKNQKDKDSLYLPLISMQLLCCWIVRDVNYALYLYGVTHTKRCLCCTSAFETCRKEESTSHDVATVHFHNMHLCFLLRLIANICDKAPCFMRYILLSRVLAKY